MSFAVLKDGQARATTLAPLLELPPSTSLPLPPTQRSSLLPLRDTGTRQPLEVCVYL